MWFSEVAAHPDPGVPQLQQFLVGVRELFDFILRRDEFHFLWEDNYELQELAVETYHHDILRGIAILQDSIPSIHPVAVVHHGLSGRPLRFKLKVVDSISNGWDRARGQGTVRGWLKRLLDAIDAILDSIIDAAGGVGGLVKEFKDAISALAKTT